MKPKNKSIKTTTKDRALTEEKLIAAAESVFSRLGFKGATTRLIAKKADINLSLINRYFDGKYGLFISMLEKKILAIKDQILDYPPQDSLEAELCHYGEFKLRSFIREKNIFKITMGQFFTDEKFLKKFRNVIPLVIGNPQLEKRLQVLIDAGKMTDKYPLPQIIDEIENQAISQCIFRIIIHGRDEELVLEEYKDFLLRYGVSLRP